MRRHNGLVAVVLCILLISNTCFGMSNFKRRLCIFALSSLTTLSTLYYASHRFPAPPPPLVNHNQPDAVGAPAPPPKVAPDSLRPKVDLELARKIALMSFAEQLDYARGELGIHVCFLSPTENKVDEALEKFNIDRLDLETRKAVLSFSRQAFSFKKPANLYVAKWEQVGVKEKRPFWEKPLIIIMDNKRDGLFTQILLHLIDLAEGPEKMEQVCRRDEDLRAMSEKLKRLQTRPNRKLPKFDRANVNTTGVASIDLLTSLTQMRTSLTRREVHLTHLRLLLRKELELTEAETASELAALYLSVLALQTEISQSDNLVPPQLVALLDEAGQKVWREYSAAHLEASLLAESGFNFIRESLKSK